MKIHEQKIKYSDLGFNKWNSQLDNFIEFPDPQDLNEF